MIEIDQWRLNFNMHFDELLPLTIVQQGFFISSGINHLSYICAANVSECGASAP